VKYYSTIRSKGEFEKSFVHKLEHHILIMPEPPGYSLTDHWTSRC